MNKKHISSILGLALLSASQLCAATYSANSWAVDNGTSTVNTTGLATDDPYFVMSTAQWAASSTFGGPVSLSNDGDSIKLTYTVTFTGVTGDAAGSNASLGNAQIRMGLYNTNGSSTLAGWLGYYGQVPNVTGVDTLIERNTGNTSFYYSGLSGTTALTSPTTIAGTINTSAAGSVYDVALTYTRSGTSLLLSWNITQTAGGTFTLSASATDTTPLTYSFDKVGVFHGGSGGTYSDTYSNVTVTLTPVPEPSTYGMAVAMLIGAAVFMKRRRQALAK